VYLRLKKGGHMTAETFSQAAIDYERIEKAIAFLIDNFHSQPGLGEIAKKIHMSEYHFQRLFSRWVGISPKRFLQYLTKEHAKRLLEKSINLLEVTYEAGLTSPGRLHDLFVTCEAVTPGEYKAKGKGLEIAYGYHATPFGECLLATTDRGICGLNFVQNQNRQAALMGLKSRWKNATLTEKPNTTRSVVDRIFNPLAEKNTTPLHLILNGTNFQIKVWEALIRIPIGTVVSYEDVAACIGMPKASRAVGNAVGSNPIPFVIPCHRVIRKTADFGNYGGGKARKLAILGWESVRCNN
ncbi:MAG: bifunctional helix-turn-helix domain-containing protein/methylated-DNA--[protein]-cysteine S-methyltransferase, partial [Desulfobacterales bacterium]|nr:bifunctional helix-turn-helix domain-containing protein/methylated-DNA--[protein]-cysteine S-methyltransferase [Desulfobacterales bacterium]